MVAAQRSYKNILKKRASFINAAKGHYIPRSAFVMQRNAKVSVHDNQFGVGFTVTKKQGNAVARNRIRRRLREAIRHIDERFFEASYDYVLVGRAHALTIEFPALCADIETTLKKFMRGEGRQARARKAKPSSNAK